MWISEKEIVFFYISLFNKVIERSLPIRKRVLIGGQNVEIKFFLKLSIFLPFFYSYFNGLTLMAIEGFTLSIPLFFLSLIPHSTFVSHLVEQ